MDKLSELLDDNHHVFLEWAKYNQIPLDEDLEDAVSRFLDEFVGCFKTKHEMIQEILHEWFPENPLIPYVDEALFAQKIQHEVYVLEVDNQFALFYSL